MTDLWRLSGAETTRLIKAREITATAATEAALARLEAANPAINAVVERTDEEAMKAAEAIDAALARVADGTYGYCDDTGEEIGLFRLEARPIATLTVEAQEKHERLEKQRRDD